MLLVLVLLRDSAPRALSTYQIGLAVIDDKEPPRPISVLIKTLKKDGYVRCRRLLGKRAGLWTVTDRGLASLERRPEAAKAAAAWLSEHRNHGADEIAVLRCLALHGPLAASRLSAVSGLLHSPVRTALKRLGMRGLVSHGVRPASHYRLTRKGRAEASRIPSGAEAE